MTPDQVSQAIARRDAGRWLAIGVTAMAVAGLFALYMSVARVPGLETALSPDPSFGHRAMNVHVNLGFGVFFSCCIAALYCLLPGARQARITPVAQVSAIAGILCFVSTLFIPDAVPLKSNYVPSIDHWQFVAGVVLFGCSIGAGMLDTRLFSSGPSDMPADARWGLRAAAVGYLVAIGTWGAAYATQAEGLEPLQYYERLFWGGGHIQQFVNVLAMISAWLYLLSRVLQRPAMPAKVALVLFGLLLAPALSGPWLTATSQSPDYFTQLMRWGLFPVTSLFIVICAGALWSQRAGIAKGALRGAAFIGFATSAVMTVAGFVMGAMIRDNSTLVPAHYHMSLGGVTVAFMAAIIELLPSLGAPLASAWARRWADWQPLIYGAGMAVMAIGFGIARSERKTYGSEQVVRSTGELIGLSTMGLGGLISSVGGVVFLVLLISAVLTRKAASPKTTH